MQTSIEAAPAKPVKPVKAQRKKTIAMLVRLGLTDVDFNWRVGASCVDDAILIEKKRIHLTHCNNATQLGRVFDITVVTPTKLIGRDIRTRGMFEIDTDKIDFRLM